VDDLSRALDVFDAFRERIPRMVGASTWDVPPPPGETL
jgi:hypothetical protein